MAERATARIFSGTYCGDGFPTCEMHEHETVTKALSVFGDTRVPTTKDYEVVAYAVNWDNAEVPTLGRKLWCVRKKVAS